MFIPCMLEVGDGSGGREGEGEEGGRKKNKIKFKSGHGFWGEMLEEAKLNSFS